MVCILTIWCLWDFRKENRCYLSNLHINTKTPPRGWRHHFPTRTRVCYVHSTLAWVGRIQPSLHSLFSFQSFPQGLQFAQNSWNNMYERVRAASLWIFFPTIPTLMRRGWDPQEDPWFYSPFTSNVLSDSYHLVLSWDWISVGQVPPMIHGHKTEQYRNYTKRGVPCYFPTPYGWLKEKFSVWC